MMDDGARPDQTVLVAGAGSIGSRHLRNLRVLGRHNLAVFDPEPGRAASTGAEVGARVVEDFEEALEALGPDLVVVCSPPAFHLTQAALAVKAGTHVFVEKPLADRLDGVDALLREAEARGRAVLVGYNLRFDAGLRRAGELVAAGAIGRVLGLRAEFGQYRPDWRPGKDYRRGYTARSALGGGIILDGSHEIEYVRWLAGEIQAVACAAGHLSDLEMDVEDIAALTLRCAGGAIAEIHLDCVQRGYSRCCKIIGERGTLVWDLEQGVRLLGADETVWTAFPPAADRNTMYLDEMRHMLDCMEGRSKPLVDGYTGRRVLEIALAARRAAALRAEVTV